MGKKGNAYKVLEGQSEGKNPLERSTRRYENDIKMHLKKSD
jgi:hypothetical protein